MKVSVSDNRDTTKNVFSNQESINSEIKTIIYLDDCNSIQHQNVDANNINTLNTVTITPYKESNVTPEGLGCATMKRNGGDASNAIVNVLTNVTHDGPSDGSLIGCVGSASTFLTDYGEEFKFN